MEFHPAFAAQGQFHPEYGLPANADGLTLDHFSHDVPPEAIEPYSNAHGHLNIPVAGSYQELHTVFADGGTTYSVSALHFDPFEELLWMGNQGGHVTSYFGSHLQKYTSFQAHSPQQEIRQLLAIDSRILSLSRQGLRCSSKQGMKIYDFKGSAMEEMRAMIILKDATLLAGGQQEKLIQIDLESGKETGLHDCGEEGITIMKMSNNFICQADTTGKIHLCDPSSMAIKHTLEAHSTSVSDFDVHENQLVSCGFSTRHGNYSLDRYLMVFDLRMMRAMPPFHIPIEALFVRYVPTFSNRVIAMSQSGHFQLVDPGGLMTAEDIVLYQVSIAGEMLMCMDVCSTYHCMVFGDVGGYVHLWADAEDINFNNMSRETQFATSVDPISSIDINNHLSSFCSIPLPFPANDEPLLSDWPANACIPVQRQTVPVDPQILSSMKVVDFIGYAPKSGSQKRNQVVYPEVLASLGIGTKELIPESPMGRGEDRVQCIVPKKYRKVEIKYSGKFGVDDFNFRHYNSTNFAGLEPHIPNAYCNCMLQVLHFIEPLRVALQSHLCEKEFCLACEMGFLFYMLDHCKGQTCQASNFLRAFRTIPEGSALGLLLGDQEESMGKANFPRLIQSWNRFVLQQIVQESAVGANEDKDDVEQKLLSSVAQMFEAQVHTKSRCRSCSKESDRMSASSLVTLNYPSVAPGKAINKVDFVTILQKSMCSDQSTYTFCEDCKKYQPSVQTRSYQRLQDVIAINCHIETQGDEVFWRKQLESDLEPIEETLTEDTWVKPCKYGPDCTRSDCKFGHGIKPVVKKRMPSVSDSIKWIPLKIYMRLNKDGRVEIKEFPDDKSAEDGYQPYSLHASIVHIVDQKTGGNLVAHINVGNTYHKRKEGVTHSQWYLFNDFSIESIDRNEAVDFSMDWKVPCILYFVNNSINDHYDLNIHNPNNITILHQRATLAEHNLYQPQMTFTPLGEEETIKEGDLVGLDAEFVSLNKEEAEIRSDGTRSTIKPSQMSVARITCVRGKDPTNMIPFIDDYISTQEQVVDYLTRFSGIRPGDLDATLSQKHLTTLKVTYLKLRYIVDCGAIFVGHGLRKDFRVINLLVPHNQIIDTAQLFNLPTQRIVSLRFLAWYFLDGLRIQSEEHDSTEDACTAVKLYHFYLKHSNNGQDEQAWQEKLKSMYEEGRKRKWQVPP